MRKRVKTQICNHVSVCSGVALQPDATNHSPDVPTTHNSPLWNSTNPISAAVVSTIRPHSWAHRRPQIRPFWLLGCMLVITPKNMLIPTDTPAPPLPSWIYSCTIVCPCPSKEAIAFKRSPHFRINDRGHSVTSVELTAMSPTYNFVKLQKLLDEKIQKRWELCAASQKGC